jgi:4'-phosphopantetheinyl transferase
MSAGEDLLLDLEPDDSGIQVWLRNQNQPSGVIQALHQTLSADELERAERFRFREHRIHFIAARGMLRQMLGRFLDIAPSKIRFQYSKFGKPSLSEDFNSSSLKFNISHSDGKVILAFAIGREVGIDIERIRPDFASGDIAERFFSAWEVERLRSLPISARTEAFFNCWTRKEAYIKAIGEGLSCPLDRFDVTLLPGEPARLVATRGEGVAADRWVMRDLDVGQGYKAALVMEVLNEMGAKNGLGNKLDIPWDAG